MKAVGQFAGGINAYNAGKYTRSMMAVNGQNALNAGVSERDAIRARSDMMIGQQMVAQGGSGFQVGTGSPLDLLKQSMASREMDLMTSRMKSANQAQDYAQRGYMAYQQGKSAMAGGIISGVGTIADQIAGAVAGAGGGGDAGGDASVGFGGGAGWDGPTGDISAPMALNIGANADAAAGAVPNLSSFGWGG